ncbi:glycosyltransferase [Geobacillus sp. E263]|uniref:glycosyltransferase n=1 Tax=Geobacillus sp. E263 TaxID=391290 RepID=UPI00117B833D|nr:glycosyltransferase [Geobacillus sp. E263]
MIPIIPKVAVILSTYNAEKYLEDCLQSISNQTYQNFVVNIIDDSSRDNTVSIIRRWCQRDERFRLVAIHEENKGLTKTLNELLSIGDYDYIVRIDADDLMMPERIEKQLQYLENNPDVSVVGSWAIEIDENNLLGKIRKVPLELEKIKELMPKVNPVIHPSVMFRRKDIMSIGGYNENFRFAQDYDLWFRCIANGLKIANLNEPLIKYRVSSTHVEKRRMGYRILDAKIRWNGTKIIGCRLTTRLFATALPIVFGLIPDSLKKVAMCYSNKIDPRQKV